MEKILEKNNFFDAHFHLADLPDFNELEVLKVYGCTSCHNENDFDKAAAFRKSAGPNSNLFISFGIHPQNPDSSFLSFLEKLLTDNRIDAIGECGFDFFTEEYKARKELQISVFEYQLELALQYNKPMIIHCRKANEMIFSYSKSLKKLPSVLFHSFMGSYVEAESFLKRGINCYFSFGKQIFNNNRKVMEIVSKLSPERLLLETDAPYQTLKGEDFTKLQDIQKIYNGAFELRKENYNEDLPGLMEQVEKNFLNFIISGGNR